MSKTTKELSELVADSATQYGDLNASAMAKLTAAAATRAVLALQIKNLAERAVAQEAEVITLRATVTSQAEIITQLQAALANTGNPSTGSPVPITPFPGGQKGDFWEVVAPV